MGAAPSPPELALRLLQFTYEDIWGVVSGRGSQGPQTVGRRYQPVENISAVQGRLTASLCPAWKASWRSQAG